MNNCDRLERLLILCIAHFPYAYYHLAPDAEEDLLDFSVSLAFLESPGNPYPFTKHFMSYPMDMTWILQHQLYCLAKCHVISMTYLFFKKDIFGYTWYIQN